MSSDVASIMMVTYNRLDLTKQTLKCLEENTKRDFNLIIVDNGSKDGTIDFLKDYKLKNLHLILNEENKGIAIGRNQALKKAVELKTDWYCTVDNDIEVPDGWLTECIDILRANRAFGMIGVNMENVEYPLKTVNDFTFQVKPRGNLGTACMVFPSYIQKMIGYFNTEYGPYGEEDADFGMRVRVLGMQMGYISRMGVHLGEGEQDVGEYREYKTECHKRNLKKFNANVGLYMSKQKPLFIGYKDDAK